MKSKKLISLLCAAAMTTSAFAGLTVTTASAAATPVWSFDGSDKTGWSGSVAPTVKTDEGSTDSYLNFEGAVGKQTNDTTFTLPTEAQLSNDYVLEYDTYIHGGNGMGRLNHYTQVAFTGATPGQDTQTYGGDYATAAEAINPDTAHSWSQDLNAGMGYTTDIVSSLTSRIELSCQGRWVINQKNVEPNFATDGTTVGDDKWVRVRAAVKDGKAAVTIADSNQKYVDAQEFDVDATKLSKIMLTFARADQVNFVPTTATTIKLDNIKVYDGIANAPAFSTDGLRTTAVVATPIPAPEKVAGAAPKQYAPEAAITPYIANFNSAETGTITYVLKQEGGQDPKTVVNGMKVQVGTRKEGEDTMTYASIVEPAAGDKALRLNAGDMSTNGRGPVVSFDDDLSIEDMTGTSTILGFSTYISRTHLDGISRLFLLDNTDNVDGNSVARDVLAVITTEDIQNEDESYKYTAGEKNIGIHVEPDQWHKIAVAISENEYRVFVDGQYKDADGRLSPALKNDLVGTGEGNKNAVTHLPMFAIENTKTSKLNEETGLYEGGSAHATALIDNVVAYQIQGEVNDKLLPLSEGTDPTPAPPTPTPVPKHTATIAYDNATKTATITTTEETAYDAVLINAVYDTDGVLSSVKSYPITGISSAAAKTQVLDPGAATGGKLMLWNTLGDMVPFAYLDVTNGEAQPTAKPAPTSTPGAGTEPTSTPGTGTEPTSTPGAGTEPTSTPVATVDPAKVSKLDISLLGAETVMYGKKVSDLGTFTLNANEGKITGTSNYVNGYTQFSSVVAEQEGHYIPVRVSIPSTVTDPTKAVVTYGTDSTKSVIRTYNKFTTDDRDLDVVYILNDDTKTLKFTVDWDGDGKEYTTENVSIDISDVTKAAKPVSSATIGVLTGATNIGDKTAEDLSTTLAFAAPTAENAVAVTGTLKYVGEYPAMGSKAQTHYYLPYKISGLNANAVVYVQSKDDFNYTDSETGKTYKRVTAESFDNAEKTELFGVQAVSAEKKSFTIMVDTDGDGTVYDKTTYTIDVSALTLAEPASAVPYADGTETYETASAGIFNIYGGSAEQSIIDSTTGNTTKVKKVNSPANSTKYARANYIQFPNGYQATGNVKLSFDYNVIARWADIAIVGTDADLGGAKYTSGSEHAISSQNILRLQNNASNITVVSGSDNADVAVDPVSGWVHVEATVDTTAKKTTLNIYNYKANNNYSNVLPVYTGTVNYKDQTITGVSGLYIAGTNGTNVQLDNILITPEEGYVYPYAIAATAPDKDTEGTLTVQGNARAGETVTVTTTAVAGKKAATVTVNDGETTTPATKTAENTFTFVMPEKDVTVAATYARADVTSVEVEGLGEVSTGGDATYTATPKAGTTTVDGTITWSIEGNNSASTTISTAGKLTVASEETATSITVKATTRTDATVDSDDNNVTVGTKTVTISTVPTYAITKAAATNGSFVVKNGDNEVNTAKTADTITVVASPDKGYEVDTVSYKPTADDTAAATNATKVDATNYTFTGISAEITITVTFKKSDLAITNGSTEDNKTTNNGYISTIPTTAKLGETVTVVATPLEGYVLSNITAAPTDTQSTATITTTKDAAANTYTFTMPNEPVTVTATFAVRPVTVTVAYVTDTTNVEGTTVATKEVEAPEGGFTKGGSVTLTDDYKAPVNGEKSADGAYKRYTVVVADFPSDAQTLSATEYDNIIPVKVETDNVEYYYYEDFSTTTADQVNCNSDGFAVTITSDGKVSGANSKAGNRGMWFPFSSELAKKTSGVVKVSFDYRRNGDYEWYNRSNGQIVVYASGTTPNGSSLVAENAAVWEMYSQPKKTTADDDSTENGNGACWPQFWTVNDRTHLYEMRSGAADHDSDGFPTGANKLAFTKNTDYHAEIYVDLTNKKVSYLVTSGASTIKSEYDLTLTDGITALGGLYILVPRGNASSPILCDNIIVTNSTMPTAPAAGGTE